METRRGYTTLVSDDATDVTLHIATVQLDSVADRALAEMAFERSDGVVGALTDLIRADETKAGVDVRYMGDELYPDSFEERAESFRRKLVNAVAPVLLEDPQIYGNPPVAGLLEELLDSTLLAEHSPAEAGKAIAQVGAATVGGLSAVMVAVVAAPAVAGAGAAILLLAPAGIIVIGTAAAMWVIQMLISRRRAPKDGENQS